MSPRRGRFFWAVTVAIVLAASRAGAQENDECSTATVLRSVSTITGGTASSGIFRTALP
jgi:hypothetical protein